MIVYVVIAALVGALAALVFATVYGGRSRKMARETFRRSAVLGIYCALVRRGDVHPSINEAEGKAALLTVHLWPEEAATHTGCNGETKPGEVDK